MPDRNVVVRFSAPSRNQITSVTGWVITPATPEGNKE